MAEEYVLVPQENLSVPVSAVDRLLTMGSGDAALVYLLILRDGRCTAESAASLNLKTPLSECLELLRSAGLVRGNPVPDTPAPEKPLPPERTELPEYTPADIAQRVETDPSFKLLLDEIKERLGRTLTTADMTAFFGFYDYLGLPPEVILILIGHCREEAARRYGEGRMPSLKQIEKEAYLWARMQLFTLEAADRYLKEKMERRSESAEVSRLLGIRDRKPSPSEERYISGWLENGFGRDAILLAYDRTVLKKGSLVWNYMNKILENWHGKGLHTVPEIEAGDRPPAKGKPAARPEPAVPAGSPKQSDMEQMRRYIDRLNGDKKNGT